MDIFQQILKYQEQLFALPVALIIGVIVLGLALDGLILWMAGCLRNADRLSYLRALLVIIVERVLIIPAAYGVGYVLAILFAAVGLENVSIVAVISAAVVLGLLLDLVILVGLLMVAAGVRPGSGMLIWLFRLVIALIVNGLIAGLVFVALAVSQSMQLPVGEEFLTWVGVVLVVVVGLALALFFGTRFTQPSVVRRTGP